MIISKINKRNVIVATPAKAVGETGSREKNNNNAFRLYSID